MTAHVRPPAPPPAPPPAHAHAFRHARGLSLLTWPVLAAAGIDVEVTARAGGVSAGPYESLNLSLSVGDDPASVLENRRRLAAAFGADLADFVFARQVHGAGVRVVTDEDRGRGAFSLDDAIPETDALVTASPGVVLAILTADCVPIILADPAARVLACVHAGWRGTVARVCAAAVAAMSGLGATPATIVAGLGPAMHPDRYQVGSEVRDEVLAVLGEAGEQVLRPDGDRWLLDLWGANRLVLREAGLDDANILTTDLATGPGDGLFFSDRQARPCGRLALVARLPSEGR